MSILEGGSTCATATCRCCSAWISSVRAGRDRRAARHERRRQVDAAQGDIGRRPGRSRARVALRRPRHHERRARTDRRARASPRCRAAKGVFPSLTVGENLRAACWLLAGQATRGARGPMPCSSRFPLLADRLDHPAADLSGGQQQMLALSMAFLAQPKLLAIDELSLGLAPVVVEQLLGIVRAIRDDGTTVILVEQSVNMALHLAETAYFMEKGQIRFHGPTAELLERPDMLRSVFLEGADKGLAAAGRRTRGRAAPSGTRRSERSAVPAPDAPAPCWRSTRLSVRFGGIQAVQDVSLSVAHGEIVGLIGPERCGKDDAARPRVGLHRGRPRPRRPRGDRMTAHSRRTSGRALGLGRSFQDSRLFPSLTVEETLLVALERWLDVRDPLNAMFRLPAFAGQRGRGPPPGRRVDRPHGHRSRSARSSWANCRRARVESSTWPVCWPTSRRWSCSTSRRRASPSAKPRRSARCSLRIRDALGASLVVVEHDMTLITAISDRLVALDQGRDRRRSAHRTTCWRTPRSSRPTSAEKSASPDPVPRRAHRRPAVTVLDLPEVLNDPENRHARPAHQRRSAGSVRLAVVLVAIALVAVALRRSCQTARASATVERAHPAKVRERRSDLPDHVRRGQEGRHAGQVRLRPELRPEDGSGQDAVGVRPAVRRRTEDPEGRRHVSGRHGQDDHHRVVPAVRSRPGGAAPGEARSPLQGRRRPSWRSSTCSSTCSTCGAARS